MMADAALQEQMLREQVARERFGLLMGLRGGLQEQAVKGGALAAESALQGEQLASQQMMGLMQGIGSLAGAYAQYRQQQEALRTLRDIMQQNTTQQKTTQQNTTQQPRSTPSAGYGRTGVPHGGRANVPYWQVIIPYRGRK
jgi:hypothetical protein